MNLTFFHMPLFRIELLIANFDVHAKTVRYCISIQYRVLYGEYQGHNLDRVKHLYGVF